MKNRTLALTNPCNEKWSEMMPTETGSHCKLCAKNVIDFTQLNQTEIIEVLSKSGNNTCARLTHSQLNSPLPIVDNNREVSFPTSKVAAGVMLATSLTIGQTTHAKNEFVSIEFVENSNPILESIHELPNQCKNEEKLNDATVFAGVVTSEDFELPVENAKITFISSHQLISTYTSKDGAFSLEIPSDLINEENVIRVSYDDLKEVRDDDMFLGYLTKDYILSKAELTSNHSFSAVPEEIYLGAIVVNVRSRKSKPVVLENGIEINYREFAKAQVGKKSTCNLHNKDYLYFQPKFAVVIYGKKAKHGLYILTD